MIYEDYIQYKDVLGKDRTLVVSWGNREQVVQVWDCEGKQTDDDPIYGKEILFLREEAFVALAALSQKFLQENPVIEQTIEQHKIDL